jgi:hypothetical protein
MFSPALSPSDLRMSGFNASLAFFVSSTARVDSCEKLTDFVIVSTELGWHVAVIILVVAEAIAVWESESADASYSYVKWSWHPFDDAAMAYDKGLTWSARWHR